MYLHLSAMKGKQKDKYQRATSSERQFGEYANHPRTCTPSFHLNMGT
jgi:hypothetical protein